ncbi:VPLPA-CTERM sorting domain-containing protein [Jannaschia sp. LMIT008]|uniref:VPLPA-CTERM sorting domain-containing protein n=1 Tax=Jannaschia maritima TaxID=3032585 RepID=UPI002811B7C3|nr:VPLPA-CTERM sorting domain-containing protein [Jannaschia sp. LMIT008]
MALALALATPVSADTVRFDFSGVVETSNIGVPGTIDSGTGATAFTASAVFDADVTPTVDVFGRRLFTDALIAFEATIGGDTVTLNQSAFARQSSGSRVTGFFGSTGSAIEPPTDALDGSVNGFAALAGNFEIVPFPGEPDYVTDIDVLLSGVGTGTVSLGRTSFDTFELTLDRGAGGGLTGFVIADILDGTLTRVPPVTDPAPIPLPAAGWLLALGLAGLCGYARRA